MYKISNKQRQRIKLVTFVNLLEEKVPEFKSCPKHVIFFVTVTQLYTIQGHIR